METDSGKGEITVREQKTMSGVKLSLSAVRQILTGQGLKVTFLHQIKTQTLQETIFAHSIKCSVGRKSISM